MSDKNDAKKAPTQRELAEKAARLKAQGAQCHAKDDGTLNPQHPEADPGKGNLSDTDRKAPPSGALDHAGAQPAQYRSGHRG